MINMLNGGPVLVLYSDTTSPTSHCARLALAEKDIETDVRFIQPGEVSEELSELNPYGTTPTLVDRDLVLYDSQIILEYLDERFPHPPLMPVDPMTRAVNRQLRYRITRDFYGMAEELGSENEIAAASARKTLRSNLVAIEPIFSNMAYFMSEEYTPGGLLHGAAVVAPGSLQHQAARRLPGAAPVRAFTVQTRRVPVQHDRTGTRHV